MSGLIVGVVSSSAILFVVLCSTHGFLIRTSAGGRRNIDRCGHDRRARLAGHSARTHGALACRAEAEQLKGVLNVRVVMKVRDSAGPLLHRGTLDLYGSATLAADQVVMVRGSATPIDRLAAISLDHVHGTHLGETL